ncbi:hypothetical protein PLICRDRAFT_246327 [Plicaturopsis crispa FD-325 SS-3]|nr:hypothetical protein PLICRDRAFT_246327 [Plicaturopsis crispa FD-325 SS-3]
MPPMRPKPHFAFLPLLDTPTPPEEPKTFAEFEAALEEELGLSTPSLTNASLDSPSTRSSSPTLSEEPGYFDIPTNTPPSSPPCDDKDAPNYPPVNSSIAPPSPLSLYPPTTPNQESVTVTFKRRPQTYTQQHGSTRPSHSSSPVRHSQPMGLPDYSTSDSEPEPTTPDPHIPYSFSRHSQPSHMKADYAKADYGSGESSPSHPQWASQLKTPSPILEPFCISMKRRAPAVEAKSGMGMTFLPLNG